VDLTFRITNCRFLLAIVFRTWDLVFINLSFASRDFVCARSTVSAFHCVRANNLDFAFCIGTYRRGHHALRESCCVSLAHGPRWLFLLSRHRKVMSAAANQKPFVNTRIASVFFFLPRFSSSEWPFPSPTNFGSLTLFLVYATAHRNCTASCTPLVFICGRSPPVVFAPSTAAYTFRFAYRTVFAVFCVCCFVLARVPCFFACQFSRNHPRQFFRGGHSYIVDLTFRITNCRFLLAIVSRTWDLVCINLSFASRDFVCARSTVSAQITSISHFCIGTYRRGHHALRESCCVSLAHGPRWLFLLSRHRKAISAAANQKPFVNKDLCARKSGKRTIKWWEPNALLRLGNLKCQAVLVGS